MARPKKDKFEDLCEDFKKYILAATPELAKQKLAEAVLSHQELMEARKNDQDLQEKEQAYKEADEIYRAGKKEAKLKIEFVKQVLTDRGKM